MDATMERTCQEDISHTVLDARQKMSVRSLSNNYGLPFAEAVKVLQQWIDKNSAKATLIKEFIVRGISSQHGAFITVANEQKLKTIQSKTKQFSSFLYSVEVAAESSRSLAIPEDRKIKMINLPLQAGKRDIQVFKPADPLPAVVKQEPNSKIPSMFNAGSSKAVVKPEPVKEEKQSPKEVVKQESPAGSSLKKSPVKTSPSKKKDAKKTISGKGSIASFFNNKPAAAKTASTVGTPVKQEKPTPVKEEPKQETKTNGKQADGSQRWKRMISDESDNDDVIPNTPQDKETKKAAGKKLVTRKKVTKPNKENPNKKSRIMQIEDSSDDEEDEKQPKEPEEREIQFDAEESNDVEIVQTEKPEKEDSPKQTVQNGTTDRKKAMVKKLVTKTFQDEEGYFVTMKEYEMVEEDEADADTGNNNNHDASEEKNTPNGDVVKGKKSDKAVDKKSSKVTTPTSKTKQGSITSFFSRK
ncbi:neurofilament heavy polypeptide-like [Wyeomyia smithii]|uniref:neurofilament heavy polypeptide-like n=1 Tax=Wyeomyia smithii TaxID=174621 RepID=UPI002467C5F4|nr:neurofilament heavy polypeptide-like [Wyeomyia smithii]